MIISILLVYEFAFIFYCTFFQQYLVKIKIKNSNTNCVRRTFDVNSGNIVNCSWKSVLDQFYTKSLNTL